MKALTIWQPWASLIACGHKTVETRSWAPPRELIGERIAIHAAKRQVQRSEVDSLMRCLYSAPGPMPVHGEWPLGAVVATAVIREVLTVYWRDPADATVSAHPAGQPTAWREVPVCACGDYSEGRWLWMLDEIEPLDPPSPARGYQGLWEWTS